MSNNSYDVVVVGAGLVGAALALLLANRAAYKIALLERAEPLADAPNTANQRVVALGKVAQDVLNEVGVLAALGDAHCHPYQRMLVWDESSHGELDFNSSEVFATALDDPPLGYIVDSLYCNQLLQQAVRQHSQIDCHFGCSLKRIDFANDVSNAKSHATLYFDHAEPLTTQLVVAADGARSWVRQQAGIFANHHSYQQLAIVAKVSSSQSHQDTAWQRFLTTGPIAILPLADNQSSIVWSADTELAEQLMALDEQAFSQQLSAALDGRLGDFDLCSPRLAVPLNSQRAQRYFKRHVVLVGDAAHSIHPLAGQGANLGFKDIAKLVDMLSDTPPHPAGEISSPQFLQGYERARKLDNEQTDLIMSALHKAYRGQNSVWLGLRGIGMNWINRTSRLKRLLAEQAIGA